MFVTEIRRERWISVRFHALKFYLDYHVSYIVDHSLENMISQSATIQSTFFLLLFSFASVGVYLFIDDL